MSRSFLRLVEPLSEQTSIPEMMPPGEKILICRDQAEVNSILQLFLLWPEYSSAVVRLKSQSGKVRISHDESLSEIENLFLSVDQGIFNSLKNSGTVELKVLFEVFGLTFQFEATGVELAEDYSKDKPTVSISIPTSLERLGVRRSKRIQLKEALSVDLIFGNSNIPGKLEEVSPRGFKIRADNLGNISPCDRFKMVHADWEVEMSLGQVRDGIVIGLPLEKPAKSFGAFFDVYVRFAYPMLRPRHSFQEDPVPDLAVKTGQAKKFASKEQSGIWLDQIKEAYEASRDAQHEFTADYVAVDDQEVPVGASSLANAFTNHDGTPIWAFHGLSAMKDPRNLFHTAATYLWRADYLISRTGSPKVIGWFDGKGKWLEKVYVKFQRLTPDSTQLWPVSFNRLIAASHSDDNLDPDLFDEYYSVGKFNRGMSFSADQSLGLGIPYLNLSGAMDMAFYLNEQADSKWLMAEISKIKPARFYCPVPHPKPAPVFDGYECHTLETVTRQFLTDSIALLHFHSSVEHSMAITRRKYAV